MRLILALVAGIWSLPYGDLKCDWPNKHGKMSLRLQTSSCQIPFFKNPSMLTPHRPYIFNPRLFLSVSLWSLTGRIRLLTWLKPCNWRDYNGRGGRGQWVTVEWNLQWKVKSQRGFFHLMYLVQRGFFHLTVTEQVMFVSIDMYFSFLGHSWQFPRFKSQMESLQERLDCKLFLISVNYVYQSWNSWKAFPWISTLCSMQPWKHCVKAIEARFHPTWLSYLIFLSNSVVTPCHQSMQDFWFLKTTWAHCKKPMQARGLPIKG